MEKTEPASALTQRVGVQRISENGRVQRLLDAVAVEEPLEIRLEYSFKSRRRTESLALTMRTPGHDRELAVGFLFAEGVIRTREDVLETRALGGDAARSNELLVSVRPDVDVEMWRMSRATFVSSSCGVCGKRHAEALAGQLTGGREEAHEDVRFPASLLYRLPGLLRSEQAAFAQTGGLHAAALVNETGQMEAVFEDIGRHNALDKLVGYCLLAGRIPLARSVLFLSSRGSFELVQKAAMAGAPVLATVGSASSLAVESARRCGLTLAGFVRQGRFNLYSGEWRIHS